MENQATETQAMQNTNPTGELVNALVSAFFDHINKMVDSRVERIMATQASAAVFNDSLDERIRAIAQDEAKEAFDSVEDEIHDKVAEQIGDINLDDQVLRAFENRVNWEEHVQEYVDNELDDKIEAEVDNKIDDAVESKLDDVLEEKVREVLIKIINGE